jgi:hypothetical protein
MKKLTTVIMVLSLVLGGVALAVAADVPQTSKNLDLSAMQKISDQEAKQLRGTANGFLNAGANCTNVCQYPLFTRTQDRLQSPTQTQDRIHLQDGSCLK